MRSKLKFEHLLRVVFSVAAISFLTPKSPALADECPTLFCLSTSPASISLTAGHSYPSGELQYDLSWTTVDPSTTNAIVTYYVFQRFGLLQPDISSLGNAVRRTESGSISVNSLDAGTRCFQIVSHDSLSNGFQQSDVRCHNYVHNLTNEAIVRTDGDGTQRGVDQIWDFTYSIDSPSARRADGKITARIYPPGTSFTANSEGFYVNPGSSPVKTLVNLAERSGELGTHSITNTERWDSRNSSGAIVPNGIYYLSMEGYFPNDSFGLAAGETRLRGTFIYSIPVDILRILNLTATGISPTNARSVISYFLTGKANVRVVIAKPGSGFLVDNNGLIQAASATTNVQDNSLVVSSFTFQRDARANTESWDGTSSTGAVLTSGVYPVGISATDDYGNHAIDASGNEFPVFTTIALERTAGSNSGTTTASDAQAPTIVSLSPGDGSATTGSVSTIVAQFSDAATGGSSINLSGCAITVKDPSSVNVPGIVSNNATDTITFTPTTPLRSSGIYTLTITAADTAGQSATYTRTFTVSIRLDSAALESTTRFFPNPAKNGTTTIRYALSVDATTDIEIFNILGERVYNVSYNDLNSPTIDHIWDLKNNSGKKVGSGMYLVKIKSKTAGSSAETTKKLVVIQ